MTQLNRAVLIVRLHLKHAYPILKLLRDYKEMGVSVKKDKVQAVGQCLHNNDAVTARERLVVTAQFRSYLEDCKSDNILGIHCSSQEQRGYSLIEG